MRSIKLFSLLVALLAAIFASGSVQAEDTEAADTEVAAELAEAPPVDAAPPEGDMDEASEESEED